MDTFTMVEVGTQLVTVLLLVCGIPPCLQMYKQRDTGKMNFTFCLVSAVNAVIGLLYGQMTSNQALLNINILALAFNIPYIAIYIYISRKKNDPVTKTLLAIVAMATFRWYLRTVVVKEDLVLDKLGQCMFLLAVILWISPVAEVQGSIAKQSSEDISIPMLIGSIACCSMWFWYGMLLKDFYIYSPNIIGLATSSAKILILFVYSGKQKKVD